MDSPIVVVFVIQRGSCACSGYLRLLPGQNPRGIRGCGPGHSGTAESLAREEREDINEKNNYYYARAVMINVLDDLMAAVLDGH